MLKLKLQYFGHLLWRADSLEKALVVGKIEGMRNGATEDETVGWHHQLNEHEFEQTPGDIEGQVTKIVWLCVTHELQLQFIGLQRVRQ